MYASFFLPFFRSFSHGEPRQKIFWQHNQLQVLANKRFGCFYLGMNPLNRLHHFIFGVCRIFKLVYRFGTYLQCQGFIWEGIWLHVVD